MSKRKRWIAGLLLVGFLCWFGSNLSAADATTDNIKIGPLGMNLTAGLSLRWTDNVSLLKHDPKGDWSATGTLGLNFQYPINEHLQLGFGADLGYTRWADHDDASAGITGTSALGFDIPLGTHAKLNIHDSYTRSTDPVAPKQPFVSNLLEFDQSSNTAGFSILREFNKAKFTVGYDYITYRVDTSAYKDLERNTQQAFADLAMAVNPKADLFVRYSYALNEPQNNVFRDSTSNTGELGLRGKITQRLSGEVAVGYEQMNFSHKEGSTDGGSDFSGITGRASLNHRLSNLTNQTLAFSYQPQSGYSVHGNYYQWYNLEYTLTHKFSQRMTGRASLGYDRTIEVDKNKPEAEDVNRYIVGVGASWQLNSKTALNLDYSHVVSETNHDTLNFQGYAQNNVTAALNYTF